ncbi:MAG: NUDIX hydrolase [Bacteroidetes bacterium HGW-Bacteroidetes-3]|jgi:8-oxo-dGTP pyrophosphatase MutT (NUDIX family)|nr:MAG: NUDIX hydrolase [Bacteroidetes bacterium HGW-Bacteroidetes-3]
MYKVFVNDCPIILTDNKKNAINFNLVNFENIKVDEIVGQIFQNKLAGIALFCENLENNWKEFQSCFKIQKAAGGKVVNANNEVLFIYRFNKWDLPKGKLEKGESVSECAVREVEEECSITNLQIVKPLETTYHIYQEKGKTILKITYWFLMRTEFIGELTPQSEEGIEQVVFKNEAEIKSALENTYENIKLLF